MNALVPADVGHIRERDTTPARVPIKKRDQRAVAAAAEIAAYERAAAPMHWIEQRASLAAAHPFPPYESSDRPADGFTEEAEIVRRFLDHVYHMHPLVEPYPPKPEEKPWPYHTVYYTVSHPKNMSKPINIRSGVQIPKRKKAGRPPLYPFGRMKKGDSFFLPLEGRTGKHPIHAAAGNYRRRHPEFIYTVHTIEENGERGVRIWRLAA